MGILKNIYNIIRVTLWLHGCSKSEAVFLRPTLVKVVETWGFLSLASADPTRGPEKRDVVARSFLLMHCQNAAYSTLLYTFWDM
jgi:hypothetical protein